MIVEADNGRALADLVVAEVRKTFPSVQVERPISSAGYHGSLISFTPINPDGAPVLVYANYDWSFQLEVDGVVLIEDLPMDESESERVARIVTEVTRVGREGLHRPEGRLRQAFSAPRRVQPWA